MLSRRIAVFGSLAAAAAVVALVASFALRTSTATVRPVRPPAGPVPNGFPAPPAGAIVFSHQVDADVLALAVTRSKVGYGLQASILDGQGSGARGLDVSFHLGGPTIRATACGPGCYRAATDESILPRSVVVIVRGAVKARWRVALPALWPPSAAKLVARAGAVWRSLRSLAYRERLASDRQHSITSLWRVAAPDRAAYEIVENGSAGIVIGGRRWDKEKARGRWVASSQSAPINQPVPFWASVTNAHLLGTLALRGRPAHVISFFDPGSKAWFKVYIDTRTLHTVRLTMMTTAHFMHESYYAFDSAAAIAPPT